MAFPLYSGWGDWAFVGGLEGGCARVCLYRAGGRSWICSDRFVAELRYLDKLADRGCCSPRILRLRVDSPATQHHNRCPGLAAVLSACLFADCGYAFHPMAASCCNRALGGSSAPPDAGDCRQYWSAPARDFAGTWAAQ